MAVIQILVYLLFLCFVCLSKAEEEEGKFFTDLQAQLAEQNNENENELIPDTLSCGTEIAEIEGTLFLKCDEQELLTELFIVRLKLDSIPASISLHNQSLKTITIFDAELTSLGEGFGSLANLNSLKLNSNSLTALPADFSSLTLLSFIDLGNNLSLEASTDLFEEMSELTYLKVSNTLISGSKPEKVQDNTFECDESCISAASYKCSKNTLCACSSFSFDFCKNKSCSACESSYYCVAVEDDCPSCGSFDPTKCPSWCSGKCGECSMITNSPACVSPCSWCSSLNSCQSSSEECPNKPSDTDTDTDAKDDSGSSSTTIILICVLVPVFVLAIAIVIAIVVVVRFLHKRHHDDERSITMTVFETTEMDTTTFA